MPAFGGLQDLLYQYLQNQPGAPQTGAPDLPTSFSSAAPFGALGTPSAAPPSAAPPDVLSTNAPLDPMAMQPGPQAPVPSPHQGGIGHILKYALPALGAVGLGGLAAKQGALSQALGGLAQGFAEGKLKQWKTTQDQKNTEQQRNVEMAHKVVMEDLQGLPPSAYQKYPKLNQLAQKYRDSLANDSMISPKEAADIIVEWNAARGEIAQAKQEQVANQGNALEDAKQRSMEQAQIGSIQRGLEATPGLGMLTPQEYARRAGQQFYQGEAAKRQYAIPTVEPSSGIMMTPAQRAKLIADQRLEAEKDKRAAALQAAIDARQQRGFAQQGTMLDQRLAAQAQALDQRLAAQGSKMPEPAVQTVESLDMGRAAMERLQDIIKKAGLQNSNEPIGPKLEKFLYSKGVDPGELDRQVNQLSGLGMANMLQSFSGRFRNQKYMDILSGHMPAGGMSYQMLYNMSKDLLPYVNYKRKQTFRMHGATEIPYESPDLNMNPLPGGGSAPAGGNPYR